MIKNENTHIPYENEPDSYNKVREQIHTLMMKINECKKETAQILNNDILAEEYGDDPNGIISDLNGVVRFLGEAYGFLLSDDILQEATQADATPI